MKNRARFALPEGDDSPLQVRRGWQSPQNTLGQSSSLPSLVTQRPPALQIDEHPGFRSKRPPAVEITAEKLPDVLPSCRAQSLEELGKERISEAPTALGEYEPSQGEVLVEELRRFLLDKFSDFDRAFAAMEKATQVKTRRGTISAVHFEQALRGIGFLSEHSASKAKALFQHLHSKDGYVSIDNIMPDTASKLPSLEKMRAQLRAAYGSLEAAHRAFDTDGTGEVTPEQFAKGLASLGVPEMQAEYLFAVADNDDSGTVDVEEFWELLEGGGAGGAPGGDSTPGFVFRELYARLTSMYGSMACALRSIEPPGGSWSHSSIIACLRSQIGMEENEAAAVTRALKLRRGTGPASPSVAWGSTKMEGSRPRDGDRGRTVLARLPSTRAKGKGTLHRGLTGAVSSAHLPDPAQALAVAPTPIARSVDQISIAELHDGLRTVSLSVSLEVFACRVLGIFGSPRRAFEAMDADGTGYVTWPAFDRRLAAFCSVSPEQSSNVFRLIMSSDADAVKLPQGMTPAVKLRAPLQRVRTHMVTKFEQPEGEIGKGQFCEWLAIAYGDAPHSKDEMLLNQFREVVGMNFGSVSRWGRYFVETARKTSLMRASPTWASHGELCISEWRVLCRKLCLAFARIDRVFECVAGMDDADDCVLVAFEGLLQAVTNAEVPRALGRRTAPRPKFQSVDDLQGLAARKAKQHRSPAAAQQSTARTNETRHRSTGRSWASTVEAKPRKRRGGGFSHW
mmetsp:Transcript_36395/g.95600  ORF Transcript_36395/g.95600 Transcript_36395/m.95600 type:complete len:737 (+) Transcript_36395:23-2233(+)